MTAIDPIEPRTPMSATQQAVLLSALVFVAVMVIGVCLVIGVGAAHRPASAAAPEMDPSCRLALDRARAADRGGSSDQAIKAAKQMLEICRT